MEIVVGGEKQLMTRHEIVLLKAFESALRGRITALCISPRVLVDFLVAHPNLLKRLVVQGVSSEPVSAKLPCFALLIRILRPSEPAPRLILPEYR